MIIMYVGVNMCRRCIRKWTGAAAILKIKLTPWPGQLIHVHMYMYMKNF